MSAEPTRHFEVKTYAHKGVNVTVEIDYIEGKIALVEKKGTNHGVVQWGAKQWVFANRTIDYMQGWQNILDAMKYAVEQSTKDLKKHQDAEDKRKRDLTEHAIGLVAQEKQKKK